MPKLGEGKCTLLRVNHFFVTPEKFGLVSDMLVLFSIRSDSYNYPQLLCIMRYLEA